MSVAEYLERLKGYREKIYDEPLKLEVPMFTWEGDEEGKYYLMFLREPDKYVLHRALVRQWANRRLGTRKTKRRGEVRGGGRKPWRQKHTGRARHGSIRSPLWKGGGVVFGPQPRDFSQKMNKKERKLALYSLLHLTADKFLALKQVKLERPSTKEIVGLLGRLGVDRKALFVYSSRDDEDMRWNLILSVRNLPEDMFRGIISARNINPEDFLSARRIVFTVNALDEARELFIDPVNERVSAILERIKAVL